MTVEFDWYEVDKLRRTVDGHTDPSIRNLASLLLKVVQAIEDEQVSQDVDKDERGDA